MRFGALVEHYKWSLKFLQENLHGTPPGRVFAGVFLQGFQIVLYSIICLSFTFRIDPEVVRGFIVKDTCFNAILRKSCNCKTYHK